ncbi:MAG: hypothetical protein ACI8PD_000446 [Nitrospinales bacterium]|jgi:hypothetical protein
MSKDSIFVVVLLGGISLVSGLDIFSDLKEGASIGHITTEGIILSFALIGVFRIVRENLHIKKTNRDLHINLERSKKDTVLWKNELRQGYPPVAKNWISWKQKTS